MDIREVALAVHKEHKGKIEVLNKLPVSTQEELSVAYTPGVAEPCKDIYKDPAKVYDYTSKGNLVAVVSDGTAVLGLGNIGPEAAMPVMEGKAVLFKAFAGVDAFPICLGTTDVDKIVETVKLLEPTFGGINLEDIAAPACFEVERRLKEIMDIPVFHDDQHGTAVIVLAGLTNALRVVGKKLAEVKVVINGAGAAGTAICKMLLAAGTGDIILCDRNGAIYEGRTAGMNWAKEEIARLTNREGCTGSLADALREADVFIGVSSGNIVSPEMVRAMASQPIIFALANPVPEISPREALGAGAAVVSTGRSDYPNQINNVLAFPGIFRGALDVRAREINEAMKLAAAQALANLVSEDELSPQYVIPKAFDPRVAPAVAAAVAQAAMESGVARVAVDPQHVAARTKELAEAGQRKVGLK